MMKKLILIAGAAVLLTSCGGSGITKDSKADFTMEITAVNGLGAADKDAERAKYKDKVIEIKGLVKGPRESKTSANPNKYFCYIVSSMEGEDYLGVIVHTDTDVTKMVGKSVTVKGTFEYAGAVSLKNSAVYE